MEHAKQLNPRTRYSVIPNYSVVVQQEPNQTVVLTAEDIARLHMDVSTQPSHEVVVPGIKLGDES